MTRSRPVVHIVRVPIALFLVAGVYLSSGWWAKPRITVERIIDSTGGMYSIEGSGYERNEMVSVEIKNAPLTQPSGWHLGNASTVQGRFSFQTEDFHCVQIDDHELREQYKRQRVIFVATGLNSGHAATTQEAASGILICP